LVDESGGGVRIGRLRWLVTFVTRQQTPQVGGTGIDETPVQPRLVHAEITSVTDATFWGAAQTETPITHAITMRWQDYPDQTIAVVRSTNLPGGGVRTETFRVRKVSELGGRKRYVRLLCQLEMAT
jgi:head-tail adaptor